MIKISCAPAKHFKALKNGAIRRQKTPVSDPLWRFAVVVGDVMFGRLFQEKPSLEQLTTHDKSKDFWERVPLPRH